MWVDLNFSFKYVFTHSSNIYPANEKQKFSTLGGYRPVPSLCRIYF